MGLDREALQPPRPNKPRKPLVLRLQIDAADYHTAHGFARDLARRFFGSDLEIALRLVSAELYTAQGDAEGKVTSAEYRCQFEAEILTVGHPLNVVHLPDIAWALFFDDDHHVYINHETGGYEPPTEEIQLAVQLIEALSDKGYRIVRKEIADA